MSPKPKALSTILDRAVQAADERHGTSAALREQMHQEAKEKAVEVAQQKLETATTPDDWDVATDVPTMRMALVLTVAPNVQVVLPKLGGDLLLKIGSDPMRWPTIRDLAHLGDLINEYGLA
jgi:hypothetical protein